MAGHRRRPTTPRCRTCRPPRRGSKLPRPISTSPDQLNYTSLKADFDGVITAVGAETGQNVNAGQMVVKLARPDDKDGVFNIAETAFNDISKTQLEVVVWALSNPDLTLEGVMREISPVADPVTRTYTVTVTLNDPPP